jgi:SNF2 family DNA or RNA helicase
LVFSQWTGMLDVIETELQRLGIKWHRLDGSTTNRSAVVEEFQSESGAPVMLVSLKAGGTGLTLTRADHVYVVDPWWNPAVEQQAADRAHRIGQERPVVVFKLIAEDTLEEKILQLQDRKRELASSMLDGTSAAAGVSIEELAELLD